MPKRQFGLHPNNQSPFPIHQMGVHHKKSQIWSTLQNEVVNQLEGKRDQLLAVWADSH